MSQKTIPSPDPSTVQVHPKEVVIDKEDADSMRGIARAHSQIIPLLDEIGKQKLSWWSAVEKKYNLNPKSVYNFNSETGKITYVAEREDYVK